MNNPSNNPSNNRRILGFTALLGLLAMVGPVGLDIFLASIPKVAIGLGTTTGAVAISISAIMLGNAVGIIFHGPLSDRFGRRPVIFGILALFTIGALGSALSPNVEILIAWRFVQGIAMSGGRILVGSVGRDLFDHERLGKFLADTMFVMAIVTVIGPIAGGQMALYLPWPSTFYLMAGFGVAVLTLFAIFFKETAVEKNTDALKLNYLVASSMEIARNRVFLKFVFCGGFTVSGFIAFLSAAPAILINNFGVREDDFGFLFASVTIFFVLGTFMGGRLVLRFGQVRLITWGSVITSVGGIIMVALALAGFHTPAAIIAPMAVFATGVALVLPQANAAALQPFPRMAGMASSVQGFIHSFMAAAVSFSLTAAKNETALAMACVIAGGAVISLVIIALASRADKDSNVSID